MSSTLDSAPKSKMATGDVGKLKVGKQEIDLPIVVGTENEPAVDIGKLRAQTGFITLDEGYVNTGACTSAITYLDGEKGVLRYRGYPIEVLAERSRFRRSQLPADLRRIADRRGVGPIPQFAAAAHDAARRHAVVLQRLAARRPSDGDAQLGGRRAVDLLSRFARSARPPASGNFGPSADGQAADDRGLQLQEIDRPAVHLSAQRSVVSAKTSCT